MVAEEVGKLVTRVYHPGLDPGSSLDPRVREDDSVERSHFTYFLPLIFAGR